MTRKIAEFQWLSFTKIAVGLVFSIIIVSSIYEIYSAYYAGHCGKVYNEKYCYPWIDAEVFKGESWGYSSKNNYIISCIFALILSVIGILSARLSLKPYFISLLLILLCMKLSDVVLKLIF